MTRVKEKIIHKKINTMKINKIKIMTKISYRNIFI